MTTRGPRLARVAARHHLPTRPLPPEVLALGLVERLDPNLHDARRRNLRRLIVVRLAGETVDRAVGLRPEASWLPLESLKVVPNTVVHAPLPAAAHVQPPVGDQRHEVGEHDLRELGAQDRDGLVAGQRQPDESASRTRP